MKDQEEPLPIVIFQSMPVALNVVQFERGRRSSNHALHVFIVDYFGPSAYALASDVLVRCALAETAFTVHIATKWPNGKSIAAATRLIRSKTRGS